LSEIPSSSLADIARVLVGIVRGKNGPQDLPATSAVLVVTVLAALVPDALLLALLPAPLPGNPVVLLALGMVTTLIWYGLILKVARRPERFLQTLTAVFGVQLVLAPVLVFSGWFLVTYQADPTFKLPAALLRMAVEVWALIILARILRAATDWPTFACVALAIANELLAFVLISAFFPQAAGVTPAPV
jgi:hypothetical protein